MVEELSGFDFDGIEENVKDISSLWYNPFPNWTNGTFFEHYSDLGPLPGREDDYKRFGWLDGKGEVKFVIYKLNKYGFRTPFTKEPSLVVAGCSNTFGTGLNIEQTWGYKLAKKLDLPLVNIATPGASNDQVYRLVKTFLPELSPKLLVCLMPDSNRHEFFVRKYTSNNSNKEIKETLPKSVNINSFHNNQKTGKHNFNSIMKEYIEQNCTTPEYQLSNFNRNIDAIKGAVDCNFYYLSMNRYLGKKFQKTFDAKTRISWGRARDLSHFGEGFQVQVAKDFLKLVT